MAHDFLDRVIHLGALTAPLVFTWQGVLLFRVSVLDHRRPGSLPGIPSAADARQLSDLSLAAACFWPTLGLLAGEGPPITWVAVHRKHHQFSDQAGDPHSPHDGGWWSHMLWLFPRPREPQWTEMIRRYGKDLLKDPFMRLLDETFLVWHLALGALLLGVGWLGWDLRTGLSLLVYGMFLRLVWVLHVTWAVNSASHIWGYRNYQIADNSRNLWWVGLLAWGEGWHNNHHAFPGMPAMDIAGGNSTRPT